MINDKMTFSLVSITKKTIHSTIIHIHPYPFILVQIVSISKSMSAMDIALV